MGALSFWYFWFIRIRKRLINFILKKTKFVGGASNWPIFRSADCPCFLHNFLQKHHNFKSWGCFRQKIQEICTKMGTRIFKIDQKMTVLKMGQFEPPLKYIPFFKGEIYHFFSNSCGSNVPKWKLAHILLCKK